MLTFTLKCSFNGDDITITRSVTDDANIATIVGEMLYAVETMTKAFTTHDLFEMADVPEKVTLNKRILTYDADGVMLTISAAKKKVK